MIRGGSGLAARLAVLATALVVGPATLAPGTAEAPGAVSARAGEGTTAAQHYGWGVLQWDFAWEFGQSLTDGAVHGADFQGGSWVDHSTGTGRVVKYGGGIEFHSGESDFGVRTPDFGTTTLELEGNAAQRGRWELRERLRHFPAAQDGTGEPEYTFLVELIPEDPAAYDCGRHNITIARAEVGGSSVMIGVNSGSAAWTRTLDGFGRADKEGRLYGLQVTKRRITWYVNGNAVASLRAAEAIPKIPMTVRMRMVGKGNTEMRKSYVLIDWVRSYDLTRGKKTPRGQRLTKGPYGGDC